MGPGSTRCATHAEGAEEDRCGADMAHTRQKRTDYGLGLQIQDLQPLQDVPASLGSGARAGGGGAEARQRVGKYSAGTGCRRGA